MRVAIVVAFYDPSVDYFETTAARALSVNNEVSVVTTVRRSHTLAESGVVHRGPFPGGTSVSDGVTIHRLVPWLSMGQRSIAAGVRDALETIHPDVVIQIVPAQYFSIPASAYARLRKIPIIYVSGENSEQGPQKGLGLILKRLYMRSVWRFIARSTAGKAKRVIVTTEETRQLLKKAGVPASSLMPLPYRSDKYFLSQKIRDSTREQLGIGGKFVTIFVGRFVQQKRIESVVDAWSMSAYCDPNAHLLLVGSTEDAYSQKVRMAVAASPNADRITVLPFAEAKQINGYLNAADVGVWPNVSIGIQQAMGTGLLVLIPVDSPGKFLLQGPGQELGRTYTEEVSQNPTGGLTEAITWAQSLEARSGRELRAKIASDLYSDRTLADRVIGDCV